MRVLVTAGGTRTYLDEVRWFGNVSTGTFGSEIVAAWLARGADVVHLCAESAVTPRQRTIDLAGDWREQLAEVEAEAQSRAAWWDRYRQVRFVDVEDYAAALESLVRREEFDVAVLAAAVSDYAPEPGKGKLSSDDDELLVRLHKVDKLIARVKDWDPSVYLVGFKLLVGASKEELVERAIASRQAARADLVVANDLRLLRQGNHTIHLVREGKPVETFAAAQDPAERLVERIAQWLTVSRRNR